MKLRALFALLLTTAVGLLAASPSNAAMGDIPTPNVTGPIAVTADSHPFLATDIDLSKYGYVENEYFVEGDGYRYSTTGAANVTGSKILTGGALNDGKFPFKTRIVVRRPANPADANGKVVAEWNNVTSTQDVEFNWMGDPFYLLKNGYTFVGVTAQNVGVASLKAFNATRYGSLTVNGNDTVLTDGAVTDGDALSYDVFSSVLKAIDGGGTGVDPMGGINPDTLIASGESQSCGRLATHYNKVEPIHEIVDGYLLTVCGSSLRTDRPEKVIRILSETENRTSRPTSTFPDTTSLRQWEVAGASHLPRLAFENLNALLTRDGPFGPPIATCTKFPLSLVQWPYVQNSATDALVKWVNSGTEPAVAPRGEYVPNPAYDPGQPVSGSNPAEVLKRDEYGIAQGAIRFPEVTVPTATNDGINSTAPGGPLFSAFCPLLGSSTPFTSDQLQALYTDFGDYVDKYAAATDQMVGTGFLLAEDAVRLKDYSRTFADLRPTVPVKTGAKAIKGKFSLKWRGTEAPDTTFQLQRAKSSGGKAWKTVKATFDGASASLSNEPQGTHRYRVGSTTIVPGTNISEPRTAVTPYSEELANIKVDRSGPKAPKLVAKGKKVKGKKGTFKGKVTIKVIGKPDARLPDGSAGVGLNPKSFKKTIKVKKKGKTVVKVTSRDKLGNKSKTAKLVIKIK